MQRSPNVICFTSSHNTQQTWILFTEKKVILVYRIQFSRSHFKNLKKWKKPSPVTRRRTRGMFSMKQTNVIVINLDQAEKKHYEE